ncbi:ATP-binding protein [Endozoicomonas sp. YOMI1]|uniref:AAA family ATPase n=1 Tax=Endozoicomonas sp. YOMI1 TaxID=2828739 RepID=UPI00214985A3|nr:ATP-binding protein [Endozoicomonas sp. YOMI1]
MLTGNNVYPFCGKVTTDDPETNPGEQGSVERTFDSRSVRSSRDSASQYAQYMQAREALLGQPQAHSSEYCPGQGGDRLRRGSSIMPIITDSFETKLNGGIEAETSTIGGSRFNNGRYRNVWLSGPEPNSVVVATGTPINSAYVCLNGSEGSTQTVKVLKRDDVEPQTAYLTQLMRKNCRLSTSEVAINLTTATAVIDDCWDSVVLNIQFIQAAKREPRTSGEQGVVTKRWQAISGAFLQMCHQSHCPLQDSHSYLFSDGDHLFVAKVNLRSSGDATESTVGLLARDARVTRITVSDAAKKKLNITDVPAAIDIKKLAEKFDYNGEAYGIGGANGAIRQFVDAFISPRLVPGKLQNTMKCQLTRGGILSGPPGTGKTLFIRVIESLLRENGFIVSTQIISGPEVFNKYVGESEQRVRGIFSDDGLENKQSLRLVLIDEIDSMLPARGRAGDNGTGDKVVNQFLTCMDGIDKKNNLIVFGTTNRPDLIDPAVMRPGRMDMQMKFNLPEDDQRLQILKIQTRDLTDGGMLNPDVSLAELAKNTAGFSGAELGALVEKARQSALRRGQGLAESDTFFCPQALSQLETLDVSMADFKWAFNQVQPQFGKSNFMSLAGKTFEYEGYLPEMVNQLKTTLADFKRDDSRSTLRILIKGPQGSGKSTLAALANHEFGAFCSYVSATDVVKSRDRTKPLNDVFAERRNHQTNPDCHFAVIIDDFDTMINYNSTFYDRTMVSVLDAHTKQSLQGLEGGKLLTLVTATEHEEGGADFLPRLFPDNLVFKTMPQERQ